MLDARATVRFPHAGHLDLAQARRDHHLVRVCPGPHVCTHVVNRAARRQSWLKTTGVC